MQPYNPFSLDSKVILVTGASSGIGRAIAVACAGMGASVIITGRNEVRLRETLSMMQSSHDHQMIVADLTDGESRDNLVDALPRLDGLVQCAGVGSRVFCKEINPTEFEKIISPNLEAPILLQAKILLSKKINKKASIVFISSAAAYLPTIGNAVYSASKGAIISYAKCLALELAPRQIRVNCICPAMIWTDLILQDGLTKEDMEVLQLRYPLKRYGQPEDVANLAIYLLSDASVWMTGTCVELTGGTMIL